MKENLDVESRSQEKEMKKPYESIHTEEWMAEEMINEVKKQGHNPEEIDFSAGYSKGGTDWRDVFFTMNFRDGNEWFKAYWSPENRGKEFVIEYSGEAIDKK